MKFLEKSINFLEERLRTSDNIAETINAHLKVLQDGSQLVEIRAASIQSLQAIDKEMRENLTNIPSGIGAMEIISRQLWEKRKPKLMLEKYMLEHAVQYLLKFRQ